MAKKTTTDVTTMEAPVAKEQKTSSIILTEPNGTSLYLLAER
jgi:hypothetical protein